MCFLCPLLSEQSLGSATTLVSTWKTNLFYRLETFVPIRKTNLSPVDRIVSFPKQTPDCIPTVQKGRLAVFEFRGVLKSSPRLFQIHGFQSKSMNIYNFDF